MPSYRGRILRNTTLRWRAVHLTLKYVMTSYLNHTPCCYRQVACNNSSLYRKQTCWNILKR